MNGFRAIPQPSGRRSAGDDSISVQLEEVSRLMRSPLVRNFGQMSEAGREGFDKLGLLLSDLPGIEATTPGDALALVSIAGEVFGQIMQNVEGNALAEEAAGALACILLRLRACVAGLAGMDVAAFGFSLETGPQRVPNVSE